MHVLLTRPRSDAEPLASRLAALGCKVSLAPMFEIFTEPVDAAQLSGAAGLVITSRNAVKALAGSRDLDPLLDLPLFAVGQATAACAATLGFQNIRQGPGTAAELVPQLLAFAQSRDGRLVHLAGDHLAFDLSAALAAHGAVLDCIQCYRTQPANELSAAVKSDLEAGRVDAVILMSPRTAKIWQQATERHGLHACLTNMAYVCLSDAVATAIRPALSPDARVFVAEKPNAEEIVALVRRLAEGTTKE
jgi:uroporphyrinogen-III synthase